MKTEQEIVEEVLNLLEEWTWCINCFKKAKKEIKKKYGIKLSKEDKEVK